MFPRVLFLHVRLPPLGTQLGTQVLETQVLETQVSFFELKSLRLEILVC